MHAILLTLALATSPDTPVGDIDLAIFATEEPQTKAVTSGDNQSRSASNDAPPLAPLPPALVDSLTAGSAGEWSARAGDTLHQTVNRWAEDAGWQLIWAAKPETDVVLDVDVNFPVGSTMQEAIRGTFRALSRRPVAPKACEYTNKTLRIVNLGDRCE